jgi:UDP-N-acetyl-D-glucosamine dehydrogenase
MAVDTAGVHADTALIIQPSATRVLAAGYNALYNEFVLQNVCHLWGNMVKDQLLLRLNERTATVAIMGLGYVGLPLAVAFAEEGFNVIGYEVSQNKADAINRGESYIQDIPSAQLERVIQSGNLRATTDAQELRAADVVSICVPTPLTKTKDPDMTYVQSASNTVASIAHPGLLIILESTTYPGTTDEYLIPRMDAMGLKVGEDVFIAFSPERIDPANPTFTVRNTPKVVGGVTEACQELAYTFYRVIVDKVVKVSSTAAAEMVKLLENTFRAVNIGFVNEMALMCEKLGINVWEVIEAAKSKPFGFMPFYPGPGLGGHCIPLDPLYLSWKMRELGYTARFIEVADTVNTGMPEHVVRLTMDALNDDGKALRNAKVIVLGVAYKRDVDDMRESPALHVIHHLQKRGALVEYHDPHVPHFVTEDGIEMGRCELSAEWLHAADCVVITTDHSAYDYDWIVKNARLLVDTRNALKHVHVNGSGSGARVVRL